MPIQTLAGQLIDDAGNVTGATATYTGQGTFSDVAVGSGKLIHSASNTVARTDTTAKNLFTLPANAVIVALRVYVPVASDAGTSATLNVGKSGTAGAFITALDVKGSGVGVVATGAKSVLGSIGGTAVVVQGIYAEVGTASTTGGPFLVLCDYTTQ